LVGFGSVKDSAAMPIHRPIFRRQQGHLDHLRHLRHLPPVPEYAVLQVLVFHPHTVLLLPVFYDHAPLFFPFTLFSFLRHKLSTQWDNLILGFQLLDCLGCGLWASPKVAFWGHVCASSRWESLGTVWELVYEAHKS